MIAARLTFTCVNIFGRISTTTPHHTKYKRDQLAKDMSVANERSFYVKRKKAGKGGWYFHSIRRADKAKQCIDTDPYIHTYTLKGQLVARNSTK